MFSAGLENRGKRGLLIDNKVCRRLLHACPPPTTSGEQVLMLGVREGERGGGSLNMKGHHFSQQFSHRQMGRCQTLREVKVTLKISDLNGTQAKE